MKVALIDADLIGRPKHRFPNLAVMKIAGYHKDNGDEVYLKMDYDNLAENDITYISKVFTDTDYPELYVNMQIANGACVEIGGTGFYFDKAPNLPYEIEHHMPDYHIYDEWLATLDKKPSEHTDYSIGFVTRGCFRRCPFCVNQKYDKCVRHSPLEEFYDPSRKKICLLDDNVFACPNWEEIFLELMATGKRFKFKQGLDERLLTPRKCELLFSSKYDGDITFAFDWIEDRHVIEEKIKLIRQYTDRQCVFYVLCAFDRVGCYDYDFWLQDVIDTFERIKILQKYKMLPYIMRFACYDDSPYRGIYITLARWCNQFSFMKKNSFREYCRDVKSNGEGSAAYRYMTEFEQRHPEIAKKYFDLKWGQIGE